jgi:hypothetical protein
MILKKKKQWNKPRLKILDISSQTYNGNPGSGDTLDDFTS